MKAPSFKIHEGMILAGERQVSQDELTLRAARAATAMKSIGIGEGDSVAVIMRNDLAFLEVMLGAALIGAYVAPVNWHATSDEAAHILKDSGARLIVIHADLISRFAAGFSSDVPVRQVTTPSEIAEAYGLAPLPHHGRISSILLAPPGTLRASYANRRKARWLSGSAKLWRWLTVLRPVE